MLRILPLVALLGRSRAMSVRSATTAGPLRVLCLHGKGGSAREFAERTKFVSELLPLGEVELVCVDAPHSLGEGRGFAWWSRHLTSDPVAGPNLGLCGALKRLLLGLPTLTVVASGALMGRERSNAAARPGIN